MAEVIGDNDGLRAAVKEIGLQAIAIMGAFSAGAVLLLSIEHQNLAVSARVANRNGDDIRALLPRHAGYLAQYVAIDNGTRLELNCMSGQNDKAIEVTIMSGPLAHQGGDRVLLPAGSRGLSLKSGSALPTQTC